MKKIFLLVLFGLSWQLHAQYTGQALGLDGVDDYVSIDFGNYNFDEFTLECWINVPTYDGDVEYISISQNSYLVLDDHASGVISTQAQGLNPVDAGTSGAASQPVLSPNTWHHLAFTYDGTSQRIYIDGDLYVNLATTGAITKDIVTYFHGMAVGAAYTGSAQFVSGLIDEVRVWNIARSAEEIMGTKNVLLQGLEDGLVGYWRFDGDITDLTGNGQDGTLNGGAVLVDSSAAPLSIPAFYRETAGDILQDSVANYQASWGDYDNDGFPDLFVPSATSGRSMLYHNNGNGTLSKTVAGDLGSDSDSSYGSAWGDYDNDGDLDLFVANASANALYRNNGDGTFTRTVAGDLGNDTDLAIGGAWADYDVDGFLDLFVVNNSSAVPNRLYHNEGDGTFTLTSSFSTDLATSWSCAWGDYNKDGLPDLYVANGNTSDPNYLYRNNGGGSFTKITTGGPAIDSVSNFSVSWVDYDSDGDLDLFATTNGGNNLLYENNWPDTSPAFTKVTTGALVTETGTNYSGLWGDYDNDGDPDVLLAKSGRNVLLKNDGSGNFSKDLSTIITDANAVSLGGAWADFDRDGDLDLFITSSTNSPNAFYINQGNDNNWITLELEGTVSNHFAVGASVELTNTAGQMQYREVTTQESRGQGSLAVEFGLGNSDVENIIVTWPSGASQLVRASNNQFIQVVEGQAEESDKSRVLLLAATRNAWRKDVQSKLIGTGQFAAVDLFAAESASPTLAKLQLYDAVLVWSEFAFADRDAVGDTLGAYIEEGGNVIAAHFALQSGGLGIGGSFDTNYRLLSTGTGTSGAATLGTVHQPDHPIMHQVDAFDGNDSYRTSATVIGGEVIAEWSDGLPLIVVNSDVGPANAKRVDLNFWPTSSDGYVGGWDVATDGARIMANSILWMLNPPDPFTKVVEGDIVADSAVSSGVAWGDYNGDGYMDLVVGNTGGTPPLLYQNNGDGSFTKMITDITGTPSYSPAWGDYDNDGDLDLFVPVYGGSNMLFGNNGDGSFSEVLNFGDIANSTGGAWADYDGNGYLDLFISNVGADFLYRNNGNGTFTEVTPAEIAGDEYVTYGGFWADYDSDGFPDLYICNYDGPNTLLHNNGDSTFTKITSGEMVTDQTTSTGASWGDYDNDGDLDLFVANYEHNNNLYQNNGDGTFTKVTNQNIVTDGTTSLSSSWVDYNNDGDQDLFVGTINNENDLLYQNNGDGTFTQIALWVPVTDAGNTFGAAWADYDKDGDQDLFASQNNASSSNLFYTNNGNSNNWINIELEGVESNRSAIGARIYVTADGTTQLREITTQSGFGSQNSRYAAFGVSDATEVSEIFVIWPSGRHQYLYNVEVNQFISIVEDTVSPAAFATGAIQATGGNTVAETWNATNTGIEVAVPVANDASLDGGLVQILASVDGGAFGQLGLPVSISDANLGGTQTVSISETDLEALAGFTEGVTLSFRATITDLGENTTTGTTSPATLLVDQTPPAPFTTGAVASTDGTILPGIWNASNTTLQVTVPIANDPSLEGGTIQLIAQVGGGSFENLGSAVEIPGTNIDGTQGISITEPELMSLTDFEEGAVITFNATLTDKSGNPPTTGSPSATTLLVDEAAPVVVETNFPQYYNVNGGAQFASVTLSDNGSIDEVVILFKGLTRPNADIQAVAGESSDGTTFTFDLAVVETVDDPLGLGYRFRFTDGASNQGFSSPGITHIEFKGGNSPVIPDLKFGSTVADYQIVSIPLELESKSVAAVFGDDLGAYDIARWRIFHYANGGTAEIDNGTVRVGDGYWLIATDSTTVDLGDGTLPQASQSAPFRITLTSGWNQIGNPYMFNVSWQDVLDHNGVTSGVDTELTLYNSGFVSGDVLKPFRGAFVYLDASSDLVLDIPVTLNESIQGGRKDTHAGKQTNRNPINSEDWKVDLHLSSGDFNYHLGGFGMHDQALLGRDDHDRFTVPRFIEYLEVNFARNGYEGPRITRDVVPASTEFEWNFDVSSNTTDDITIAWDNSYWGASDRQLVLFDMVLNKAVDMRAATSYTFSSTGSRSFRIYFGDTDYIKNKLTPGSLQVGSAYPNPFGSILTIPVIIPSLDGSGLDEAGGSDKPCRVDAAIFDVSGKLIKKIGTHYYEEAGYYRLQWDGSNQQGAPAGKGVYFVRISVTGGGQTKESVQRIVFK